MKKILFLTTLTLLLISNFCFAKAGSETGNGGDAVICYTDATRKNIKSVQMFDYWEQQQVEQFGPIELGAESLTVQQKIEIATERIAKFDPTLASEIKKTALNLANNIQKYIVTNYILPDIEDAHPKVIPTQANCYIEQFAVQYKDLQTGQRRFAISDKFYNDINATNDTRAGIILHEAIYRYAILQNPLITNSDGIRYFNYVIASEKIGNMTLDELPDYINFLKKSGINFLKCNYKLGYYYLASELVSDQAIGKSCYNQLVRIDQNISVEIKGAVIAQINNFWYKFNSDKLQDSSVVLNITKDNFKKSYNVKSILKNISGPITLNGAIPNNSKYDNIEIDGPLNKKYLCDSNIQLDNKNFNTIACDTFVSILFDAEVYIFGNIKKITSNTWSIENKSNSNYRLLNSQYMTKLIPKINNRIDGELTCNSEIIIDNNMNLIKGCAAEKTLIKIDGEIKYIRNYFEVGTFETKSVLKAQFSNEKSTDPKFNGLRLFLSKAGYFYHRFCDSDHTVGYTTNQNEYIDSNGEVLYDVVDKKTVFKSDELVAVIDSVECHGIIFESKNY